MSEWWTYTLHDLILFSSRAYHRLFELYNAAIWPAQILAVGLGLATVGLSRLGGRSSARWIAAILAAGWLCVALAFHAARYATLNPAAPAFAWIFGIEAALLLWVGVVRGRFAFGKAATVGQRIGLGLAVFAVAAMPFAALVFGRSARAAEIFGLAPDPTAIATLGLLLLARFPRRWVLMALPVLWCVVTGAVLWTLKTPDFWIPPLAGAVAVVAATRSTARG
jgi:Family of unknown function (DUF6064)